MAIAGIFMQNSKRLLILSRQQIHDCYSIPSFNAYERSLYFELNAVELAMSNAYKTTSDSVHFILLLGYCKAKNQLFNLNQKIPRKDTKFIFNKYFQSLPFHYTLNTSKSIKKRQRKQVINFLKLTFYHAKHYKEILNHALAFSRKTTEPKYIFNAIFQYFEEHSILTPGYACIQDIISKALTLERNRLTDIRNKNLTSIINNSLNDLLEKYDIPVYLAKIKQEPTYFNYKAMRQEVEIHKILSPLYEFSLIFIDQLNISKNAVLYYSSLILYYTTYNLRRLKNNLGKLYLLCYIFERFKIVNDNLGAGFRYHVDNIRKQAAQLAIEQEQKYLKQRQDDILKSADIVSFFVDDSKAYRTKLGYAKACLFKITPKEKVIGIIENLRQSPDKKIIYTWECYEKLSQKIKLNLRQLFLHLQFQNNTEQKNLFKAIEFLKKAFNQTFIVQLLNNFQN